MILWLALYIREGTEKMPKVENVEVEIKELIVVRQLPIIEEQLKKLSLEIDNDVKEAKALICTEDTVKEIKKTRSSLTKKFAELEEKRMFVKNSIMKPYLEFEDIYKLCVSEKFKSADKDLKIKIDDVENQLKENKSLELKQLFAELREVNRIDFVSYEQVGLNVTLSASIKSLKEQVNNFFTRICEDLELIETQEHQTEIMVEYKKSLNCSSAITTVNARLKAIEEQKQREIERQERLAEQAAAIKKIEAVVEVMASPVEIVKTPIQEEVAIEESQQVYQLSFRVTATKEKLQALKTFLIQGGYEYE